MIKIACFLIISAFMAGAIHAADSSPSTASTTTASQPDATVSLDAGSVAAGIGYVWGSGKLNYQGTEHAFKLSGVSIVDVGAASISATGEVSHLNSLADFNGNYVAFDAGITIAGGASVAYLKNEHGVVIKLVATTSGLRFNLAANGVRVRLKA